MFYVNSRCNKHILSLYVSGVLVYDVQLHEKGSLCHVLLAADC